MDMIYVGVFPIWNRDGPFDAQAYLPIFLDAVGLFRFLAFWVVNKGGTSGKRPHLRFWVFFLLAVAVRNVSSVFFLIFQKLILAQGGTLSFSGTPFLAYFIRTPGCVPRAVRSVSRIPFGA